METVNVAVPPSLADTSLTESAYPVSSFRIVPTPCARTISAAVGLLRFRKNVSSSSKSRSPNTGTLIVWVVVPGGKVRVPETVP